MTGTAKGGADQLRIDKAMLESLASWFAMRNRGFTLPHSFNDQDAAELLSRAADRIRIGPRG